MVFGEIICKVFSTGFPVFCVLPLFYVVFYPIKPHIHCLGSLLFYCVVYDPGHACVVGLYGGGMLDVAHFLERVSE
jgi:hypothetical protein